LLSYPVAAEPEVAARTFADHLDHFFAGPRPLELGLKQRDISNLQTMIEVDGIREDGTHHPFFLLLGAQYYDRWPPTAAFVDPATLAQVDSRSIYWPTLKQQPSWAALHNNYKFSDGSAGQMICITFTAEYYRTSHSPPKDAVWLPGRHTVAATITRVAELLRQPYYGQPGNA
jgi:hypothetical protein